MNQLIVNIHTLGISSGNHETWCSIVERISGSDVTGMMVRISSSQMAAMVSVIF